jgi:tRNA(Ile)-lysidine synthase
MRHRKIKKMMIDAKVPLPLRDRLPMVLAGDVVIWIPGFQPAKGYIAQRDSGRCVVIEARKG